jgi:mycofactocin precursor
MNAATIELPITVPSDGNSSVGSDAADLSQPPQLVDNADEEELLLEEVLVEDVCIDGMCGVY